MRRASVTWTAEMTAELVVRTEAGETAAEIAERLGIADRHVWHKRQHLGIKPPAGITKRRRFEMDEARRQAGVEKIVWNADAKARLADMVARRVDLDEIAEAFQTTSNAISTKISKMGLRRNDEVDPLVLSRMLELARARWRTSRIAKQLGVDPTLVRVHVGHLVDDSPLGYGRPPVRQRSMEAA